MKLLGTGRHRVVALGLAALLSNMASGQESAGNAPAGQAATLEQKSGLSNYLRRAVKITGSIRERWEDTDGSDFCLTPADSYLLSQVRLGIQFQPVSWLSFFGQAQDARVLFYGTKPGSAVSDPFDLRQAFVAINAQEGRGFAATIGRQEMTIGSGRLLNATPAWWANSARTFDVARASFTASRFRSEVLAGSVVQTDADRMDRHKAGDHFYGIYNTFNNLLPGLNVEPYFIARTLVGVKSKDGRMGDMLTLAAGGRIIGKRKSIDYSFEAVHEMGSYANDNLRANGVVALVGWTISKTGWAPRVSSDFAYASGDDGRNNGRRGNFDNMFGSNQPINSVTGLFGWKNIEDWRTGVELTPHKRLRVKVDYRDYWLADTRDGLYNASGTRTVFFAQASSSHVGQGIETLATLTVSKNTSFAFGVGTLFCGEYLKQANKTSGFVYPLVAFNRTF